MKKFSIAIIDLGGQYCHLIRRRLRDKGYRSEILDSDVALAAVQQYSGIILSGGPHSVYENVAPTIDPAIVESGLPILGICYGHQLLATSLGGDVARGSSEYGASAFGVTRSSRLFSGVPDTMRVWMSHSDSVTRLPAGFHLVGSTSGCSAAAFEDDDRHLYGLQFHPEVDHTEHGSELLANFAQICGLEVRDPDSSRVADIIDSIRSHVGTGSVFFLVSGGVDSMVAFSLCARALGRERVRGLYVDTGFMRLGETQELERNLDSLGLRDSVHVYDASELFFKELADYDDPEEKRKIIGRLFVEIQAQEMRALHVVEGDWFLGQGTIYPDTIESGGGGGKSALIKTHHNRCDEIRVLIERNRVVEPLVDLYKDEVRQVGRDLGLDANILNRWPFPGPGLAIRALCNTYSEPMPAAQLPLAGRDDYRAYGIPIKTVGVQGDGRTYRKLVALEGPFDSDALEALSVRVCNSNQLYNRVGYVVRTRDGSSFANAVVRSANLNRGRVAVLQRADAIVRRIAMEEGLLESIWQFPVILLPVIVAGLETIVLRPVDSENGMTASFSRLTPQVLYRIADTIIAECAVGAVLLDATDKPPATIEWE